MNILLVFALTIVAFKLAYRFYGRYLDGVFEMDHDNPTPAKSIQDSRDYVPGKWRIHNRRGRGLDGPCLISK
jgi:carbon starvation protein CstA